MKFSHLRAAGKACQGGVTSLISVLAMAVLETRCAPNFPTSPSANRRRSSFCRFSVISLLDAIGQLAVGATHDSKWIADDHRR
jgi:hypothetical protein